MPWKIQKSGSHFNVVKESDGKVVGHKLSKQRAKAMLRALYANVHNENNCELITNKYRLYGEMKCPNCGEKIPRLSKVCPICGYHIQHVDNEEETTENFWSDAARAAAKQGRNRRLASYGPGYIRPGGNRPIPTRPPVVHRPIPIPKALQRPMPVAKRTIGQKIKGAAKHLVAKIKNKMRGKQVTRPVARPIPRAIPVALPVAQPVAPQQRAPVLTSRRNTARSNTIKAAAKANKVRALATKADLEKRKKLGQAKLEKIKKQGGANAIQRPSASTREHQAKVKSIKAAPHKARGVQKRLQEHAQAMRDWHEKGPGYFEKHHLYVAPISKDKTKENRQRLQKGKAEAKARDRELARVGREKAKQEQKAKTAYRQKQAAARNKRLAAARARNKGKKTVVRNNCELIGNFWTAAARAARHSHLKESTKKLLSGKGQGLDQIKRGANIRKTVAEHLKATRQKVREQEANKIHVKEGTAKILHGASAIRANFPRGAKGRKGLAAGLRSLGKSMRRAGYVVLEEKLITNSPRIMSRAVFVKKILGEKTKSCPACGQEMTGKKMLCPSCRKPGGAKKGARLCG